MAPTGHGTGATSTRAERASPHNAACPSARVSAVSIHSVGACTALSCVRTVFLHGAEGAEVMRYAASVADYFALNVRQTAMQAGYFMVVNTFLVNTVLQVGMCSGTCECN